MRVNSIKTTKQCITNNNVKRIERLTAHFVDFENTMNFIAITGL